MPAPFDGDIFRFTNPDGSEISVRGWGNQFHAVFETLDGYTVVKDPDSGFFHYAVLSEDRSELRPSGTIVGRAGPETLALPRHMRAPRAAARAEARAAHDDGPQRRWEVRREQRRAHKRNQAGPEAESDPEAAAPVGDYVGLCLLVQFPDVQGTITRDEVYAFCNEPGYSGFGNNGSVYDYFLEVSDGKLRYTNQVTDYYTAQHDRSYYTDPAIPFGTRARELIVEALDSLKASGYDFSALTSDGAGLVYALNVFHAGPRINNWSEGLWPHQWSLAAAYAASAGKSLYDYQITDMGAQLTLRTFCHENGHMVCSYPDLYDYGNESYGVGHYSLMCYGGSDTNPTHVDAYLKNEAAWTSNLRTVPTGATVTVHSGTNDFLIHSRSADEYFILENRQQLGRDASLPDAGLAVWHVDETGSNSNEQMTPSQHYELSLEQADNRFDLEHRTNPGDSEDLYGGPSAPVFGSSTAPGSSWWDGTASGLEIEEISAPGPSIDVRTKGAPSVMTDLTGTWAVVGVDWGCTGSVATAGPFTFNADGTWSYAFGGGRWFQVGDKVTWNFTNAAGLVYSADASASAMSGAMGYLTAGGIKGCFYALRTPTPSATPAPASLEAIASALTSLLPSLQGRDVLTAPPSQAGNDVAMRPA
jgi:M6 family metalloprotease-like protein